MIERFDNPLFRAVTLGINIRENVSPNVVQFRDNLLSEVQPKASRIRDAVGSILEARGIESSYFRLAVNPVSSLYAGWTTEEYVLVADSLEELARESGAHLIGGYAGFIEGHSKSEKSQFLAALPEAMHRNKRLCGFLNVASTASGLSMNGITEAVHVLKNLGERDSQTGIDSCARFSIACNARPNTPYMPLGFHGDETHSAVLNLGVEGLYCLNQVFDQIDITLPLQKLATTISEQICALTQQAEQVGLELAEQCGVPLGSIDVSLAPSPRSEAFSLLKLFRAIGVEQIDTPGSVAVLAMVNDAIKRGALMGSSYVKGLSGTFISVAEDSEIWAATQNRPLSLDRLLAMTAVCSVGIDMVAIPVETPWETIVGLVADEMALGCVHGKITAVRLILSHSEMTEFADNALFGRVRVSDLDRTSNTRFIARGGFIPPPIHGFRN